MILLIKTMEIFSMKRICYFLMLAIGMAACSNDTTTPSVTPVPQPTPTPGTDEKQPHTITFTAPETRTHLADDETYAEWDTSGEYIMVYESVGTETTSVRSEEGVVSNGKASFMATFDKSAASQYRYDAVYPASSVIGGEGVRPLVKVPNVQHPSESSFDADADIMFALPQMCNSQPDALELRFKRYVALGKMTLTGLPEGEKISSVMLRIPDVSVTGEFFIDLDEAVDDALSQSFDYVALEYATPVAVDTPIYFAITELGIYANDSFTVSVTTDKQTYERTVTLPADRELHFTSGDMSIFSVDMSSVEKPSEDIGALVGNWHIAQYADDSTPEFDIYITIDNKCNVVLYQRLASYSWSRYDSVAIYADDVITGTYSDGVAWSASYRVELDASGDVMTWTNTLDAADSTVYERVESLPDELSKVTRGGFMAFETEVERYL